MFFLQIKLSSDVTELGLDDLIPDTEYTVTVYALYGEEAGDPVTNQQTTCEQPKRTHTCTFLPVRAPSFSAFILAIIHMHAVLWRGGDQTKCLEHKPVLTEPRSTGANKHIKRLFCLCLPFLQRRWVLPATSSSRISHTIPPASVGTRRPAELKVTASCGSRQTGSSRRRYVCACAFNPNPHQRADETAWQ